MESQEKQETGRKRKVLIGALIMCIERSRVRQSVAIDTVRSILESASGELWREGEFRLEMVWKILCQQPGLSPKDVAPPLYVFKANEEQLQVKVRMPEALAAIPLREQERLRKSIDVRAVDFAATIEALRKLAAEAPSPSLAEAVRAAGGSTAQSGRAANRRPVAVGLGAAAVLALAASLYFSFRDTRRGFDFSETANVLQIKNGQRVENAVVGELTDQRWEKLPADDRKKAVAVVFEHAAVQGIHALTLIDPHGQVRATAFNDGRLQVLIR